MAKFITEDDIEQSILQMLKGADFRYDILCCDPSPDKKEDLNDGTSRSSKRECVLPRILKESLYRINSKIPRDKIDDVVKSLSQDFSETDMVVTNYNLYKKIRNYIKVDTRAKNRDDFEFIRLIDFDNPLNNTFTAVSQMWIQGRYNYRRPDVLIFVNGLPLVFIELKNSVVKVQEAYNKNLQSYKEDIPNLFAFNQICVLSNGLETRMGSFNSSYDYFFEWLKEDEKEKLNREAIISEGNSIKYFIKGLLKKENLVDYIENFILFQNQTVKIIAKNHQYLGVNNLFKSVLNREKLKGKLGVFWHTQGSGKSYSMVMFARKVSRKINGNFSFLVITDREDLDTQIHKNFVRTEVIGNKEECQPKDSTQLRSYLQTNKPYVFTLIHKFRYDKTQKYPILSTRDDIIVMVDEAHRTQYKDLAENMRAALPNANFVAFTGTPLLGTKRLTNRWFGDYVSEYNFAQSVEDGSTVPLFYSRRVPEVGLTNNFLDDDIVDIIEDENLNEAETTLLENSSSRILEVIKREDRLDKIAKDIAHHFPRRGFLGKGLVVSVDKFTAVKMYEKVQFYWNEEKKNLVQERNHAQTREDRDRITAILDYMNKVDMAVVLSVEGNDVDKFKAQGLDLQKHINKMNEVTIDGLDIEDRFKNPNDTLQLVFVCAMWLTGFDVPNLSTLYLDKPMKGHTLMQAIARANRVYPNKPCGIIVDYVNVFKYMQKALSEYAIGDNAGELPAKNIDDLITNLDECIDKTNEYLISIGIDVEKMLAETNVLDKLDALREAYNKIVEKSDTKDRFKVLTNTMINLYEASKPEIFERHWHNEVFPALQYLHGLLINYIDDDKINRAKLRMAQVLDSSVTSAKVNENKDDIVIHETKIIDLSKIDVEALRKEIKQAQYKAIAIDNLTEFIEKALEQMINKNCTRIKFSERYKNILDRYNAGGSENEDYYEQLLKLMEELKMENSRPAMEGLTEEELEIYDLLIKGRKLTKAEEHKVKLAAKHLFQKLTKERKKLFIIDWYKEEQSKEKVREAISSTLDEELPLSYDKEIFNAKTNLILSLLVDKFVQGIGIAC